MEAEVEVTWGHELSSELPVEAIKSKGNDSPLAPPE